jgi:hypothetical protein
MDEWNLAPLFRLLGSAAVSAAAIYQYEPSIFSAKLAMETMVGTPKRAGAGTLVTGQGSQM